MFSECHQEKRFVFHYAIFGRWDMWHTRQGPRYAKIQVKVNFFLVNVLSYSFDLQACPSL